MRETIRQWLHGRLVQHGLWDEEATQVLRVVEEVKYAKALAEVLDQALDGYPKQFHAVAWLTTRKVAFDWLTETKPLHFARHMLEPPATCEAVTP